MLNFISAIDHLWKVRGSSFKKNNSFIIFDRGPTYLGLLVRWYFLTSESVDVFFER